MRTILLPFDGSASAVRAVGYAIRLAQDIPALRFDLLHVLPAPIPGLDIELKPDQYEKLHADDAARILRPATRLFDEAGLRYACHCRAGSPANEIAKYAGERRCEAIVMGTRGMGAAASLFIGSVATRVINLVSVPVTLVK